MTVKHERPTRDRSRAGRIAIAIVVAIGADASAEPAHHQGSNPGQLTLAGTDRLARRRLADWDVRLFTSFLHATEKFDDDAALADLSSGGRVRNYGLNSYAEYRIDRRWAASALVGVQRVDVMGGSGGDQTLWSLSDSQIAGRYTRALGGWSIAMIAGLKIPGTYPENEATGAKQIDQETKMLLIIPRMGSDAVSLLVGAGYKLRFSGLQDEITPTVLVPVRAGALTLAPVLTGGIAVGAGSLAKDALAAGVTFAWRLRADFELTAAYYQTIYGHNVVAARIATLGLAAELGR